MKIKKVFSSVILLLLLVSSTVSSTKPVSQPWKIVGVLTGGACVVGFLKYLRDAVVHWSDRHLVGAARSEFFDVQEQYREVLRLYKEVGVSGVRDYIISKGHSPLDDISRFYSSLNNSIKLLNSYLAQLSYLAKKNETRDEVVSIYNEIERGSIVVNALMELQNALNARRSLFELEVVVASPLPRINVKSPFQNIEHVTDLNTRIRFLRKRYHKLVLSKQLDVHGQALLEKTRILLKELEVRANKVMASETYKQELRLKQDTKLAQERLRLERDRFRVERRRLEVEEEKARELYRKNRLEEERLYHNNKEKVFLAQKKQHAEEQKRVLQEELDVRDLRLNALNKKIQLLEQQKARLQNDLDRMQGGEGRYREAAARLEKRVCELQEKINKLKALVSNPPMNPNHTDYGKFLAQQIAAL